MGVMLEEKEREKKEEVRDEIEVEDEAAIVVIWSSPRELVPVVQAKATIASFDYGVCMD